MAVAASYCLPASGHSCVGAEWLPKVNAPLSPYLSERIWKLSQAYFMAAIRLINWAEWGVCVCVCTWALCVHRCACLSESFCAFALGGKSSKGGLHVTKGEPSLDAVQRTKAGELLLLRLLSFSWMNQQFPSKHWGVMPKSWVCGCHRDTCNSKQS